MRAAFTCAVGILVLIVGAASAVAETELVVLGPVATGNVDVAAAKAAVAKAKVGTVLTSRVDAACMDDPGCLANTGKDAGARRILLIKVGGDGGKIELVLVDVGAKLLLGTRNASFKPRKLVHELAATLKMFVAETPVDKAKALFAEGNQHYNLGEYVQALERYKLAYRIKPLAAFQFNIAQCHRKLNQHQEAIAMYQAYLVDVPAAANKAMVDSLIAESKSALADRVSAEATRERDKIALEKKRIEEQRKAKEAQAMAAAELSKTEQARIAAEREREKTYNKHPARKWMLVTGALGAAALGGGAYFGVQARDAQSSFDNAGCGEPEQLLGPAVLAQCRDDRTRGDRAALLANVLFASGGAVVATSLIVFALDPGNIERPEAARTTVRIAPNAINVVVNW